VAGGPLERDALAGVLLLADGDPLRVGVDDRPAGEVAVELGQPLRVGALQDKAVYPGVDRHGELLS